MFIVRTCIVRTCSPTASAKHLFGPAYLLVYMDNTSWQTWMCGRSRARIVCPYRHEAPLADCELRCGDSIDWSIANRPQMAHVVTSLHEQALLAVLFAEYLTMCPLLGSDAGNSGRCAPSSAHVEPIPEALLVTSDVLGMRWALPVICIVRSNVSASQLGSRRDDVV